MACVGGRASLCWQAGGAALELFRSWVQDLTSRGTATVGRGRLSHGVAQAASDSRGVRGFQQSNVKREGECLMSNEGARGLGHSEFANWKSAFDQCWCPPGPWTWPWAS